MVEPIFYMYSVHIMVCRTRTSLLCVGYVVPAVFFLNNFDIRLATSTPLYFLKIKLFKIKIKYTT